LLKLAVKLLDFDLVFFLLLEEKIEGDLADDDCGGDDCVGVRVDKGKSISVYFLLGKFMEIQYVLKLI
jgi:hypothetical protein